MKAIFISYNQALTERIDAILNRNNISGYTLWRETYGRGSEGGEPHMGTHTWPSMNSSILSIVEDDKVPKVLNSIRALDEETSMQGVRAFVWNVEDKM